MNQYQNTEGMPEWNKDLFQVLKCMKCGVMVIKAGDHWYAYPLAHGPGSGALMRDKAHCYYKWGLFARPHVVEVVHEDEL